MQLLPRVASPERQCPPTPHPFPSSSAPGGSWCWPAPATTAPARHRRPRRRRRCGTCARASRGGSHVPEWALAPAHVWARGQEFATPAAAGRSVISWLFSPTHPKHIKQQLSTQKRVPERLVPLPRACGSGWKWPPSCSSWLAHTLPTDMRFWVRVPVLSLLGWVGFGGPAWGCSVGRLYLGCVLGWERRQEVKFF